MHISPSDWTTKKGQNANHTSVGRGQKAQNREKHEDQRARKNLNTSARKNRQKHGRGGGRAENVAMNQLPTSLLLSFLGVNQNQTGRIQIAPRLGSSLNFFLLLSVYLKQMRRQKKPHLSIVTSNITVQCAHEDHSNHASEEEHNHERVDDRKPMDGIFGRAVEENIPARSPRNVTRHPFDIVSPEYLHERERENVLVYGSFSA